MEENFNEDFDKAIKDIIEQTDIPNKKDSEDEDNTVSTGLANFVNTCFTNSDNARRDIETTWMDALRQYKGVYSPDVLAKMHAHRSKANIRITRTKVKTVDSRLSDLLFPSNGDKNWEIEPTPIPQFSKSRTNAILKMYAEETGEQITKEQLDVLMMDEAKRKATEMSKVIEDQLAELRYREIMRNVIHSGNMYGTGILKGPLVAITENKQYYKHMNKSGNSKWILQEKEEITPFIEYVRNWDVYPDMQSEDLVNCRYIIQRRKMDKHDVVALSKRSDFDSDTILDYLDENPSGDYVKKSFEIELTSLGDIIDGSTTGQDTSKKYEVLEFWGYVDAKDLEEAGVEVPEDKKAQVELMANIWTMGGKVIKSSLSPMDGANFPYFFYYYDKDETSIFGQGIPMIMRDVQELINSSFRAMLDNAAISAGPQVEVNMSLLSEDEDPRDFYPFKVWLRTGEGSDATAPAIRTFNFQSYTVEFERMIELFRNYGDEVTSIPRYMWGEASGAGASRTASGLSMLMGSANITIKDQVKNFDDGITKPFISSMYHWNMQFNNDEAVKGDYAVVARGTSSLIAKEIRSESLMTFAQLTANPMDASTVKRTNLIRAIADTLDLSDDNLVLSDREIEVQNQKRAEEADAERKFMTSVIETARAQGTSPTAMLDSLRTLREDMNTPVEQPQSGEVIM